VYRLGLEQLAGYLDVARAVGLSPYGRRRRPVRMPRVAAEAEASAASAPILGTDA
jgi:hypothetical protein